MKIPIYINNVETVVHLCDGLDHELRFATERLHWVHGPLERCADCAARLKAIADVLEIHVHSEPIALPANMTPRRAIELGGVA